MTQLLQVIFPSQWWVSGTDDNNNPTYTFIDINALVTACTASLDVQSIMQVYDQQFGTPSYEQPLTLELLTSDIPGIKTAINAYLASLNAPTVNYPAYPFAVTVTLGP